MTGAAVAGRVAVHPSVCTRSTAQARGTEDGRGPWRVKMRGLPGAAAVAAATAAAPCSTTPRAIGCASLGVPGVLCRLHLLPSRFQRKRRQGRADLARHSLLFCPCAATGFWGLLKATIRSVMAKITSNPSQACLMSLASRASADRRFACISPAFHQHQCCNLARITKAKAMKWQMKCSEGRLSAWVMRRDWVVFVLAEQGMR